MHKKRAKLDSHYLNNNKRDPKTKYMLLLAIKLAIVYNKFTTKQSCFGGVDAFRVKVPPLDSIFWQVNKIVHNSFKNWTIQTQMPLPKCMKSKVFRHVKL